MILAIDPGLATCGWAVVTPRTGRVLALGVLLSQPDAKLDESTDRARRASVQAIALRQVARSTGCTTIAAEAMSFGGPPNARFAMAVSLGLSWGVIAGLAVATGAELLEIPPKRWQHAIDPEATTIDYEVVFRKLSEFVAGAASTQLAAIKERHRNHAIDACGIGVFAALMPDATTRITRGAA